MTTSETTPLILVDGSSYLFRAFHALPPLTNSKGRPTGAIYGVLNMLRKLRNDYQPSHLAMIFDSKSKTFRHDRYPAYKAHRIKMPDDLRIQIAPLHEAIIALGIPLIIVDGVEADDIIGTIACQIQQQGISVLISTGDKDLAQLVNPQITLINTMSNQILDEQGVREKFGVSPTQMIDYLSLIGDSSDNIPGIPNVGPKTAAKWLKQYHTLDNLITHANEITGKVGENLRSHLEDLFLARELIEVKTNVDLQFKLDDLKTQQADINKLQEIFSELEFKTWLNELPIENKSPIVTAKNYQIIFQENDLIKLVKLLEESNLIAIDILTSYDNYQQADLVGIAFAAKINEAFYIPLAHDYENAPQQLNKMWILTQLSSFFSNPDKKIIGKDLKYLIKILEKNNIKIQNSLWDCGLASYILNSNSLRHDLNYLSLKYLNFNAIKLEDLTGKGSKQVTPNQLTLEKISSYPMENADIMLHLYQILNQQILAETGFEQLFNQIELPLISILAKMEIHGVLLNVPMLQEQSQTIQKRLTIIEKQAYELAGETFNLCSTKQLQSVLFDKLKLPISKKTPKGQASTDENVLQELALNYPLPKLILEYRSLSKLKSTYTDKLPLLINPQTGRIHTSYIQTGTVTGRLSSKDPNLQNIPIKTAEGRKIRQAFIAPPNHKILAADYSQVELRIMAHLSSDESLIKAFKENLDIHTSTAAEVFGVPLDKVTSEQRRHAKAINFGLIYGMSSFGLAQQLTISRQQAQEYINIYFDRYPRVYQYMEKARQKANEQGYVETLYGRRLVIPEIRAANLQRRNAAERAAINAPLQGTAADIIKRAMISIDQCLQESSIPATMIMQVHDELIFEVAEEAIDQATSLIRDCMEQASSLSIPLIVHIGIGNNWDEAH